MSIPVICDRQHAYGALSTPARGFTQEQWAELDTDEQKRARQRQFEEDAAEQMEWERQARAAWQERQFDEDRRAQ